MRYSLVLSIMELRAIFLKESPYARSLRIFRLYGGNGVFRLVVPVHGLRCSLRVAVMGYSLVLSIIELRAIFLKESPYARSLRIIRLYRY
jgi:hypothetical protein